MPTYAKLNALPPKAFLDPSNFVTAFDGMLGGVYNNAQYRRGLETGQSAIRVGVSCNGTWWAEMKDGGHISSYEGIGYHACTANLWRGLLDSGAEVWIHRYDQPSKRIK